MLEKLLLKNAISMQSPQQCMQPCTTRVNVEDKILSSFTSIGLNGSLKQTVIETAHKLSLVRRKVKRCLCKSERRVLHAIQFQ
ncbi:hypothetical protein Bhyg_15268 [Pseudolycoriella hygida]|uniref:Uncharacterized protein n=1 Tax=Pseudolycoriella hygida TaxID=35572 RepID=A0A9Q0MT82_9DIPT|nr:hypothetical protein Bhyg_15268 [Pseudolycoriella hygida]